MFALKCKGELPDRIIVKNGFLHLLPDVVMLREVTEELQMTPPSYLYIGFKLSVVNVLELKWLDGS